MLVTQCLMGCVNLIARGTCPLGFGITVMPLKWADKQDGIGCLGPVCLVCLDEVKANLPEVKSICVYHILSGQFSVNRITRTLPSILFGNKRRIFGKALTSLNWVQGISNHLMWMLEDPWSQLPFYSACWTWRPRSPHIPVLHTFDRFWKISECRDKSPGSRYYLGSPPSIDPLLCRWMRKLKWEFTPRRALDLF